MKANFAFLAIAVATLSSGACSSSPGRAGNSGGAGTMGAAGSSNGGGGGAGPACGSSVTPCGGPVVGTWNVTSSCLKFSGQLDPMKIYASCPLQPISGSFTVTGTFTANDDGTSSDHTMAMGNVQFGLDKSCLIISGTPTTCEKIAGSFESIGFQSPTCTTMANGSCACTALIQQTGSLGLPSGDPQTAANFTAGDNVLTIVGGAEPAKYSYCVSNTTLTVTPQTTSPSLVGTIVFDMANPGLGGGGVAGAGVGGSGAVAGSGGHAGGGGTSAVAGSGGHAGGGGGKPPADGGAGSGGAAGAGMPTGGISGMAPCDIYKSAGNTCVTAHSTTRALFGAYNGKLYQVRNAAGTTKDINTVGPGGVADSASQDSFCSGTTCILTYIYDQSGHGNDLNYEASDSKVGGYSGMKPTSATKESVKLNGNKVYSVYIQQANAFWADGSKNGMPLGSDPQGIYMVTSGTHSGTICCFDYGNAGLMRRIEGSGTMNTVNFSRITNWGTGAGNGPWVMADLENGIYAQADQGKNQNDPSLTFPFVTAIQKNNGTTEFTLRGGDATSGTLGTFYKGKLPNGYSPMKQKGGIVLGSGGDCCLTNTNLGEGTFYEGAIVTGYPSDATEDAIQMNIIAAKYSK